MNLGRCQRYFEKGFFASAGYGVTPVSVGGLTPFAVTKRATPTVTYTDTLNTNTNAGTSQANTGSSINSAGGETEVTSTGGWRFARSFTASAEL